MLTENLEPIPHFNITNYIRVPVCKKGKEYIVYLANHYRRIYTLSTLPLCIASKITIANCIATKIPNDYSLDRASLFTCPPDGGDSETCWRASDNWYIVILDSYDFLNIQGEVIDSRKESKKQSKKDIR